MERKQTVFLLNRMTMAEPTIWGMKSSDICLGRNSKDTNTRRKSKLIYCYDNQNYTEDAYILGEVEEGEVSESYILELMSKCVDDYCSYYAETLSVLVKTLLEIKKGKTVVLEVY